MYQRLFLCARLLLFFTGEYAAHGKQEQVLAFAGGDVILPCSFRISDSTDFPTVEWSKEGLNPDVVFLYRDGCETYEIKNPVFEYRTSLIMKELKDGNISLRISNVKMSDAGKYKCLKLWKNAPREVTVVKLVVGAVSEPKLSVVSVERGGVTVQCEVNCWPVEPQVTFLDHQGNDIPAQDPKRDRDASGRFVMKQRVTLQEANSSITCRVHQPEINQTRETKILISATCSFDICTAAFAAGGLASVLLASVLALLIYKEHTKSAQKKESLHRKSSDQRKNSSTDNMLNSFTEQLKERMAELKSELQEKEEIIRQLQRNYQPSHAVATQHDQPIWGLVTSKPDIPKKPFYHYSDLDSKASYCDDDYNPKSTASTKTYPPKSGSLHHKGSNLGVKRQNSNPAPGQPIQRKHRNRSSPAIMSLELPSLSLTSNAETMLDHISSSKSEAEALLDQNAFSPLHRSYSGGSHLACNNNCFHALEDLTEES
ncbi:butyrophilin subfamily 3 member A2-like isoform X1 [Oreochromis aureus]|uniref:Ig-like domain-containing protein n=1 Tax=Oreochromis aureus TaxID=47969 RepID=A0AAZ1XQD5_OREAU|nr:butyrophilin subfamily 3 member A2-like isoform X1 [Oreochromis aureus]CAI5686085.1 unnamed protein product [Mustela putorius furo]